MATKKGSTRKETGQQSLAKKLNSGAKSIVASMSREEATFVLAYRHLSRGEQRAASLLVEGLAWGKSNA